MQRRTLLATVGAAATTALAGCNTGLSESEYDVEMLANNYRPQEFTVSTGETVTWGNTSSRGHSVTAYESAVPDEADYWASGGFDSETAARDGYPQQGNVQSGETYSYQFDVAGTYQYFCIPHERGGMVGTIVVE